MKEDNSIVLSSKKLIDILCFINNKSNGKYRVSFDVNESDVERITYFMHPIEFCDGFIYAPNIDVVRDLSSKYPIDDGLIGIIREFYSLVPEKR